MTASTTPPSVHGAGFDQSDGFRAERLASFIKKAGGRNDGIIRGYGEMVDVPWQAGQPAAAIRLQMLWNQLEQTHSFALLCGYSMGYFDKDVGQHDRLRQHTHVVSDSGERATLH